MSELENTDVENLDEDYETDVDTNEQDESSDENLNSSKKNKSNWKEMSKALKGANAKIQALEAQLATKGANSEDLRLFFLENPEFKEYKNTIAELKSQDKYKYLDMSDLVELAKIKQPKPSVDSEDFNIVNKVKSGKKELADLTEEEALQLDNRSYLQWSNLQKGNNPVKDIWG